MYLQEIFDQLSEGELSQTTLGEITEEKWPRAVMHLNLGLADLFKRFFLREGRLKVQLLSGKTDYPIDMKYAVSNKRTRVTLGERFILDSSAVPFINDVLKIERVLTEDGYELALNDVADPWALATPDTAPPTLHVPAGIVDQALDLPDDLKTSQLEVVYRARHPKIDVAAAGFDPERYEVRLPDSHLQALLYYVASRVNGPVGMGQTEGVTSINYWKRYESECIQLQGAGLQIDRNTGYDKLRDRGFV
jgi:hypothetical protein